MFNSIAKSYELPKICRNCGAYNAFDAIFCRGCGTKPLPWQWGVDWGFNHKMELDAIEAQMNDTIQLHNNGIANIISTLLEHKLKNEIK